MSEIFTIFVLLNLNKNQEMTELTVLPVEVSELEERKRIDLLNQSRFTMIHPYWSYTDVALDSTMLHTFPELQFSEMVDTAKEKCEKARQERKIREKISSVSPEEYQYLVQCKEVLMLLLEQHKITSMDIDNAIEQLNA